jgi:biopolymer transport protein ExbD
VGAAMNLAPLVALLLVFLVIVGVFVMVWGVR